MARPKKTQETDAKASKAVTVAKKLAETITKKTAETKKEAAPKANAHVVLQFAGKDIAYEELVQNAKNVYQYDMAGNPESIKEISLFVKPEENKVYFVIDGKEGSYDL